MATDQNRGGTWRAYVQLFRLSNVFTAVANVTMGFLWTHPTLQPTGTFLLLVGASCLLYTAGMVLNDVFDVQQDTRERPERPIPSGRVSLSAARWLGLELLVLGTALGWAAGYLSGSYRPGLVATALAAAVLMYDGVLKRTFAGPLMMGICRSLNVLLGMSVAAESFGGANGLVALGIGTYVAGVTWFARKEATASGRWPLGLATLVMLAGIALLAWLPAWTAILLPASRWRLFWIVLAALIGWRCVRAVVDPTPLHVQTAVRHAIHSLIVLDAALCLAVRGPFWGAMVLALLLPTLVLARTIRST